MIIILQILTPKQYSYRISDLLRLNKYSLTGGNVYGSWQAASVQRSRRQFIVIQDESTQPRASRAC